MVRSVGLPTSPVEVNIQTFAAVGLPTSCLLQHRLNELNEKENRISDLRFWIQVLLCIGSYFDLFPAKIVLRNLLAGKYFPGSIFQGTCIRCGAVVPAQLCRRKLEQTKDKATYLTQNTTTSFWQLTSSVCNFFISLAKCRTAAATAAEDTVRMITGHSSSFGLSDMHFLTFSSLSSILCNKLENQGAAAAVPATAEGAATGAAAAADMEPGVVGAT